ncbi:MAG: hypothetical protein EA408_12125 [Marinilabiliales bacterium]|nr:MAG: hypothetical protein EA408_12125 [Marinilabiliales bacterium]
MKKLIVLLALVSFGFITKAANELNVASNKTGKDISYVIAGGKSYFSNEARVLLNRIRMHLEDGVVLTIPLRNVDAYIIDGRIFHRLPLVDKRGNERGSALLELVAERNDLRLYRHASVDRRLACWFEDNRGKTGMYFVYKGDEYHVSVDERNFRTVLPFFGIQTF